MASKPLAQVLGVIFIVFGAMNVIGAIGNLFTSPGVFWLWVPDGAGAGGLVWLGLKVLGWGRSRE